MLQSMAACLAHRGPDGQGTYFTETPSAFVGLGHRRLSIIDLSTSANQPMHYEGLHVIFNGEIYNYNEIRTQLILEGHQFTTHSDTEVILHSWKQWGEKSIQRWHGMFSVVLFDEQKNEIICIRDRAGVKPFQYSWHNDLFIFGSELKAIVRHPHFERKINPSALALFLQYGYISNPHCIYQHTHKLPPGHFLRFNLATKKKQIEQYWNVYDHYNRPKLSIGVEEAVAATEPILQKAFQYRMVADVPVGVFLSGGYDSSCVTALLQKDSTEKIRTFTIGTTDNKLDEAPFARQIAAHLGTDHTEYYCTSQEALDILPSLPHFYDEPFADPSAIPTILVSRLARKDVTVALSADAGDEIFAGYNRYEYLMRYGRQLRNIPKPIRKMAVSAMGAVSSESIPYFNKKYNFHSRYDKLKNLLANPSPFEMLKSVTHVFTNAEIHSLFSKPVQELYTDHLSKELTSGFDDPLAYMMAIDYKTYMVDDILQKVDRATMSVSLEGREPFLDQDIIEWAAQIPSGIKYYNGQKKYILKQIVHKYIPREIMERPKMGFGIPLEEWLCNELKPLVEEYLSEKSLQSHGLFNAGEVKKIVADFFNGRKEKHLKVWYLLQFQLWYKQWIETNK